MRERILVMLTVTILCLASVASAVASTVDFSYDGKGSSFVRWSKTTPSVGDKWKVSSWTESNLSKSRTAKVKIYHAPGVYASHTFTYNSKSTLEHGYTAYANGEDVYMAGHKGSGTGNVKVSGSFEP